MPLLDKLLPLALLNKLKQPSMLRSWIVVLTAALFFFYIFIQMNLFNAISAEMVKELNFSAKQLSHFVAFYSYGNVIFLFPAGMLLDRFSVKKMLIAVFIVSIISTAIFATSSTFWVMNMARLTLGLAGAFSFLSAVKLASRWFEPKHMALVVGVIVTMAMTGGAVAQTPLAMLTESLGWRSAIQLVVVFGAVLVILQLLIVRDEPEGLEKIDIKEHAQLEQIGFWSSLGKIMANPQNWLSGIYISLVNLPLFVLGGIWGAPYLTHVHNFSQIEATEITSMLFIGMMIGSPLAGFISDYLGRRKMPMIAGAVLSIIIMLMIMFLPTMGFYTEISLYFAFGIIMGAQVIGYPVITESNPHAITATATSLGSVLIMSGGMLVPIFGWLLEKSHQTDLIDGLVKYSFEDFTRANYMMLIALIVALFVALFVKETFCKPLTQKN